MNKEQTVSVRYIVNNVDEAISFYKDFLGFELVMHPAPPFAMLSLNNLRLLLSQAGAGGGGHALPGGEIPQPGGWNRIHLPVDNLQSYYDELKQKGATFKSDIIEGIGGNQVLLEDPSGNLIELFESTIGK
jgi:catechol 2,3-dioxygenase-like lactoylglutathione lyase family enzyme